MLYLEFARRQRGMRQTELARASNVRQQFISQIERGEGIPPRDQRERLAVVLNIDSALLLEQVHLQGVEEGKPVSIQDDSQTVVEGTETATA